MIREPMNHSVVRLIACAALLLAASLVQATEPDSANAEQLQQQLEQARQDLATAAQRLARLQRELFESGAAGHGWRAPGQEGGMPAFDFQFDFDFDEDKLRHIVVAGFPPRLGVVLGSPDSDDRNRVMGVTPGGGADQAGIRKDDLLIAVGDQDVTEDTNARIREVLAGHKPGDTVDVLVQRGDDTELMMPVELGSALRNLTHFGERMGPMMENIEREIIRVFPEGEAAKGRAMAHLGRAPGLSGLGHDTDLVSNHAGLANYFGTDEGVLILRIAPDNPLNLEPGDVILSIDGTTVNHPIEVGRILFSREAGEPANLEVMRSGRLTEVYGEIPEPAARVRPRSRGAFAP